MNLINGALSATGTGAQALKELPEIIEKTLAGRPLGTETVIAACERLLSGLDIGELVQRFGPLGINAGDISGYAQLFGSVSGKSYLEERVRIELGGMDWRCERRRMPPGGAREVRESLRPLGVMLHVAAGNADGLPVLTVLEGLLTGNINILKPPESDGGLSAFILSELVKTEPELAGYIHVVDCPSGDRETMKGLVRLADAVVVWGGDRAVAALREMTPPDTKLIEWGHKISFAYAAAGATDESVRGAARNICETNQLLCSSCQGIFVDTDDGAEAERFASYFLEILDSVAEEYASSDSIGLAAESAIVRRTQELENVLCGGKSLNGRYCGVSVYGEFALEPAARLRNCWIRPLPESEIIRGLRPYKQHLQTVGLLCSKPDRDRLFDIFARTGAVRITDGASMSHDYCGAPHDGEYPLRRYVRVVSAF